MSRCAVWSTCRGPCASSSKETVLDETAVRDQAQAFADALVSGEMDRAIESLSPELRQHLGEVLALFPLPANDATIDSVEHSGSGYNVVLRLAGETAEDLIQTRWKDRDGRPTIVETSHLSRLEREPEPSEATLEGGDEA